MCTVSYIPFENGYFLTSNRDEAPERKTFPPVEVINGGGEVLVTPIDAEHKGSWIATSNKGRTACLLNGGFVKHKRILPYRKSRGHFVFAAFNAPSFKAFVEEANLQNIEPFTLILADDKLQVLIWDGNEKHHQELDPERSHLWSSSTLYDREQHAEKLQRFEAFLNTSIIDSENILELHGLNHDNNFVLNLPQVRTVSITHVVVEHEKGLMKYFSKYHKNEKVNILH